MQQRLTTEWLGIGFWVPPDWEIVRHSPNRRAGSLVFVDRRKQRMQLSWTDCPREPDAEQVFRDLRSRDLEQVPDCALGERFTRGRWLCYRRAGEGKVLTRAGFYDKKRRRWLDLVLPWPDGHDEVLEKAILDSFRPGRPSAKGMRWRAFNLDVQAPKGWELTTAEVKPARVSMDFENRGARATVTRIGVPEAWFDGHLENFLRRRVGETKGSFSIGMRGSHEACAFAGKERQFRPRWLVGKRYVRREVAWHCPKTHAVFAVMTAAPRKVHIAPEAFAVKCCQAVRNGAGAG
jgi:hypothetical protein